MEVVSGRDGADTAGGTWTCVACTLNNGFRHSVCEICGTARPKAFRSQVGGVLAADLFGHAAVVPYCFRARRSRRYRLLLSVREKALETATDTVAGESAPRVTRENVSAYRRAAQLARES